MIDKIKKKFNNQQTRQVVVDLDKFSYDSPERISNLKDFQEKYKYSIIPVSYYEPVPDLRKIDLNDNSESEILPDLEIKYDFSFIEKNLNRILNDKIIPGWLEDNPMFPVLDMAAYASIIEKYKPKNIIEIGAGYSTNFSSLFTELLTLDTGITAIEPFPQKNLLTLSSDNKINLKKKRVQDLDEKELNQISELKENDILFIDTSHISNMGSDTNYIFLKILPMIKSGVIVHIHDIYLPYDYSSLVYYQRGTFYNEQYLLASILANSNSYSCLYSSNKVYIKNYSHLPKGQDNWVKPDKMRGGGSFWMQKN